MSSRLAIHCDRWGPVGLSLIGDTYRVFDCATGQMVSRFSLGTRIFLPDAEILSDGYMYGATLGGSELYAVDIQSGNIRWVSDVADVIAGIAFDRVNRRVMISTEGGTVFILDDTGHLQGVFEADKVWPIADRREHLVRLRGSSLELRGVEHAVKLDLGANEANKLVTADAGCGVVVASLGSAGIVAWDSRSGERLWQVPGQQVFLASVVVDVAKGLIVGLGDLDNRGQGSLIEVNLASGRAERIYVPLPDQREYFVGELADAGRLVLTENGFVIHVVRRAVHKINGWTEG